MTAALFTLAVLTLGGAIGWLAVLLLALLVLALHLAGLVWLGHAFEPLAAGHLPEPIYTQLLRPTPPPAPAPRPAPARTC